MKTRVAAMILAVVVVVSQPVSAQDKATDATDMTALRTAVQTDRKAYVASTLKLTPDEARKFWPIYDAYQRNVAMTTRQRTVALEALVALDKAPSDLYSRNLANDLIAADESEIKARRTMQNGVMKALPPKKALRYLQLEAKFRAVAAYDIATLPLVK